MVKLERRKLYLEPAISQIYSAYLDLFFSKFSELLQKIGSDMELTLDFRASKLLGPQNNFLIDGQIIFNKNTSIAYFTI